MTAIEITFPAPRPGSIDAARDASIRTGVLEFAGVLTVDRANAAAVVANTVPLLAWLAKAATRPELEARHAALTQQYDNTVFPRHRYVPDDDTGALIAGVEVLLGALIPHPGGRLEPAVT